MKHTINIFSVALILFFTGCNDFINLYPLDSASVENSIMTPDDANLVVMGIYDALQSGSYPEHMACLTELSTDNAMIQPTRAGSNGYADLREFDYFTLTDNNGRLQSRWSSLYRGIARANLLLNRIEQINFVTDSEKKLKEQYIGEAKFLRALFYFDLVRFWGGVPLSLSELGSAEEAFKLKRSTEEEVFDAIISDLESAMDLPVVYSASETGRVTAGAVRALLAKVYLTLKKPESAIPLLKELTQAPYTYRLMETYAEVFDTDNTTESIFEIQYTSTVPGEGNAYPQFFLPNDGTAGKDIFGSGWLGGTGQGFCMPTEDIYMDYETGDSRRDYTYFPYFSMQEGKEIYVVYKYRGVASAVYSSEDNIPILRYADVLLMLAEAINENNQGPTSEAYEAVDAVRARAGLQPLLRTLNYESFKDALLHERRVELAFENHRWFDLKRFGKMVEILSAKGYDIQPFHLYYPIPRREVLINPDNISQNPGYVTE